MIGQGVTQFSEIGPGNVLTRMVQQIQQAKD
jgi:malonyl CoA-acyl carrier protein transacylase